MQPQELHPNLQSVVTPTTAHYPPSASATAQPFATDTIPEPIIMTDQLIAQENARVFSFEHGAPELERQHRIFDFIGMHKRTFAIGLCAFLLIASGTMFAFVKLKTFTGSPGSQTSILAGGSDSSSSTGGSVGTGSESEENSEGTGEGESGDSGSDEGEGGGEEEGDGGEEEGDGGGSDEGASADEEEGDGGGSDEGASADEEEVIDVESGDIDENGDPIVDDVESDVPVETPAPTPVPSTPSPVLPHKFTTASWNSNADNTKIVGDQVLTLMNDAQVLGVQSLHHLDQRDSVKNKVICSSCKYAGYLPSYSDSKATQSSYPIIWNKTSFSQVGSGSWRKMSDSLTTSSTTYAARYATWTRLQSKVNNKQIIVVNTHLISSVESGGKPTSNTAQLDRYKTHMNNLKTLINELKASNVPIYIVGNFSVNYRYDLNGYTSYFPYAAFKPMAIRSSWDIMNLRGISSGTGTTTSDNHIVDYVFTWQRSDVAANSITIASSSYGSTYKPVFYTTTIK